MSHDEMGTAVIPPHVDHATEIRQTTWTVWYKVGYKAIYHLPIRLHRRTSGILTVYIHLRYVEVDKVTPDGRPDFVLAWIPGSYAGHPSNSHMTPMRDQLREMHHRFTGNTTWDKAHKTSEIPRITPNHLVLWRMFHEEPSIDQGKSPWREMVCRFELLPQEWCVLVHLAQGLSDQELLAKARNALGASNQSLVDLCDDIADITRTHLQERLVLKDFVGLWAEQSAEATPGTKRSRGPFSPAEASPARSSLKSKRARRLGTKKHFAITVSGNTDEADSRSARTDARNESVPGPSTSIHQSSKGLTECQSIDSSTGKGLLSPSSGVAPLLGSDPAKLSPSDVADCRSNERDESALDREIRQDTHDNSTAAVAGPAAASLLADNEYELSSAKKAMHPSLPQTAQASIAMDPGPTEGTRGGSSDDFVDSTDQNQQADPSIEVDEPAESEQSGGEDTLFYNGAQIDDWAGSDDRLAWMRDFAHDMKRLRARRVVIPYVPDTLRDGGPYLSLVVADMSPATCVQALFTAQEHKNGKLRKLLEGFAYQLALHLLSDEGAELDADALMEYCRSEVVPAWQLKGLHYVPQP